MLLGFRVLGRGAHQGLAVVLRHPRVEVHAEGSGYRRHRGEREHHAVYHQVERHDLVTPASPIII